MNPEGVCVIMPAFNEAKAITSVLTHIKQYIHPKSIVVINDGSQDETGVVARQAGVVVLDLPFNLGIGGAVQTGLKYAYRHGYEYALEIDADGQHDPQHIPYLLQTMYATQPDLLIGSRFVSTTRYRASMLRRTGIVIFSLLIHLVTGRIIYDSTSGYRIYSHKALQYLAVHYPSDFPEPESIVMLLRRGFQIREMAVEMKQRQTGQSSIRSDVSLKAAYFVISNSIAILVSALKSYAR